MTAPVLHPGDFVVLGWSPKDHTLVRQAFGQTLKKRGVEVVEHFTTKDDTGPQVLMIIRRLSMTKPAAPATAPS